MKKVIFLLLFFSISICYAEHNVKIFYEKTENGYAIYADNNEFCTASIKLEFTVTNLVIENFSTNVYVIQPRKKKQLLTYLTIAQKNRAYKFSYKSWTNYGDHTKESYDTEYVYNLPFAKTQSHKVHQGYNGTFSHSNKNAIDFNMPINTQIHAIRGGIVTKVVEQHNQNCNTKDCKQYNNLIIIYHSDGTFAEYTHLKQNGVIVSIGDTIRQGQHIAYSGNTGWSTGPHLHLEVFLQKLHKRITIQTKFKVNKGSQIIFLEEKKTYIN